MTTGGEHHPIVRGWRGALSQVSSGFLYGLGFCVALVGAVILTAIVVKRTCGVGGSQNQSSSVWHKRFTPAAGLTIESHRARATKYNLFVVGSVRNGGKDSWESIEPQVRLLEGSGQVVGICRGYVHGAVRPGEARYFSVDCEGTEREPVPDHTDYTIELVNARYEMDDGT